MSRRKRDGLDEAGEAMKKEDSDEGGWGRGGNEDGGADVE